LRYVFSVVLTKIKNVKEDLLCLIENQIRFQILPIVVELNFNLIGMDSGE